MCTFPIDTSVRGAGRPECGRRLRRTEFSHLPRNEAHFPASPPARCDNQPAIGGWLPQPAAPQQDGHANTVRTNHSRPYIAVPTSRRTGNSAQSGTCKHRLVATTMRREAASERRAKASEGERKASERRAKRHLRGRGGSRTAPTPGMAWARASASSASAACRPFSPVRDIRAAIRPVTMGVENDVPLHLAMP